MNTELIMPFEDILNHPHHYISELVNNVCDSFLLYQYGPYLAVNYPDIISKYKRFEFKNELFLFMSDLATIFNISENKPEMKYTKKVLTDLIQICRTRPYQFSNKVCEIAIGIIEEVRNYQMKSKSLESAILNYSPIVGYMGKLVDPGLSTETKRLPDSNFDKLISDLYGFDTSDENLLKKIKELFIKDPLTIIKYNEVFLNIDYIITLDTERQNHNVPSDIIPFLAIKNNNARLYFILVYLRYLINQSSRHGVINKIENISSVYNKTHTGDVINIKKALESFSCIAFSENDLSKLDR